MKKIAIIGAGISGLTLARALAANFDVTLFEKSLSPGGRLCTRNIAASGYSFDHGAPFFTARHPKFKQWLAPVIAEGIIQPWLAQFVELTGQEVTQARQWADSPRHWVGATAMADIGAYLAQGLTIIYDAKICALAKQDKWCLRDSKDRCYQNYDWVIATLPAAQTQQLMPPGFSYHSQLNSIAMLPCYALMLGSKEAWPYAWQAALVKQADISWISLVNSKPNRPQSTSIVALATNRWAAQHLDADVDEVAEHMLNELEHTLALTLPTIDYQEVHRWRYANMPGIKVNTPMLDHAQQLGACGDWCQKGRVESAVLQALKIADVLLSS